MLKGLKTIVSGRLFLYSPDITNTTRIHKAIFVKQREHGQIFYKIKNRSRLDQKTQYFTYSEGFATK